MSTRFADSNYLSPDLAFYIIQCLKLGYDIKSVLRPSLGSLYQRQGDHNSRHWHDL
jgi:hypothetical protein